MTRLASALGYELIAVEAKKGSRSANPDAVDLTMQGWAMIWRGFSQPMRERRETNREARALFDRALQIDPEDADALAGSAYTYYGDYLYGWGDPGTDYEVKLLGQADRAILLAPDDARAYYVKAAYLSDSRRSNEAVGVADAGLAVNPNFVPLYVARARAENFLGRSDMAKADVERAMRLSPRDPYVGPFRLTLGDSEIYLGHFDAAIDEYHKAIDSGFRTPVVYANLAAAYAQSGKMDDAKAALAEALRLYPRLTVKFYGQGYQPGFLEGLRKAGLPEE